ncbi:Rhamnosyl O-methyltransferase [Acropora cervicornis]|uniref:Rhamnosyl O-methyltransferase n=1 Tax=Acropora cervicornis TaxID=6130 RepID=A0AAD9V123_ACRCE|nr:Rhamnosyl O-methyltransferase [Acropora cervicornis]
MATNQTLGSKIISSYETAVENHLSAEEPARYVQFKDRRLSGDMSLETMLNSSHGKFLTTWRGVPLMKDCFDLIITQQLLWDLKPQTVIELGAYKGGSALWTADIVKAYRFKSRIISVDINLSMLCPLARECPDVTYIEGDELPHPWFINEDVHVNVVGLLEYLDKFTEPGDYLLVEDTNPIKPTYIGQGLVKELRYDPLGNEKLEQTLPHPWFVNEDARISVVGLLEYLDKFMEPGDYHLVEDTNPIKASKIGQGLGYDPLGNETLEQLKLFMKDRADRYHGDQYFNDFFGYVTCKTNGHFKRVWF